MPRYIDADLLMTDAEHKGRYDVVSAYDIANTPTADVRENARGEWKYISLNTYELSYGTTAYEPVYRCSACGRVTESYLRLDEPIMPEDADFPNFCPNCGADNRG